MKLQFIRKIEFKIAAVIMLAFVVLIFFTSFYMYNKFKDFIKQQAVSNSMQITEQLNLSLDNYIKQILEISITAYTDENVFSILDNPVNNGSSIDIGKKMNNYFNNIMMNRTEIVGMAFSLKNGNKFFSNSLEFKDIQYNFDYSFWDNLYDKSRTGEFTILPSPKWQNTTNDCFILIKEMRLFESREKFGYIIFFVRKNIINNILNNTYLENKGQIFVLNKDDNLYLGNEAEFKSEMKIYTPKKEPYSDNGINYIYSDNRQELVVYNKSTYTQSIIFGVFKLNQLVDGKKVLNRIINLAILLTLFLSFAISIIISATFSRGINKIIKKLKKVSNGDSSVDFRSNKKDAIGEIGNAIATMLESTTEATNSMLLETKKSQEAIIRLKEAEFGVLQNQINPHFLYNTLESISMKALINKDKQVAEMVRALAKLFRISISRGNSVVKIRDEVEHVECYIKIQKFRFSDKIKVEFDISEIILDRKIIKFILQPIVENAIIHGLEPKQGDGCIKITGKIVTNEIILEVGDDGLGINEDKLKELNENLKNNDYSTEKIGLINVNKRLKAIYGEEYGLTIESEYSVGTFVSVRIPMTGETIL